MSPVHSLVVSVKPKEKDGLGVSRREFSVITAVRGSTYPIDGSSDSGSSGSSTDNASPTSMVHLAARLLLCYSWRISYVFWISIRHRHDSASASTTAPTDAGSDGSSVDNSSPASQTTDTNAAALRPRHLTMDNGRLALLLVPQHLTTEHSKISSEGSSPVLSSNDPPSSPASKEPVTEAVQVILDQVARVLSGNSQCPAIVVSAWEGTPAKSVDHGKQYYTFTLTVTLVDDPVLPFKPGVYKGRISASDFDQRYKDWKDIAVNGRLVGQDVNVNVLYGQAQQNKKHVETHAQVGFGCIRICKPAHENGAFPPNQTTPTPNRKGHNVHFASG
ncbi:hypothetical protein DFJ43DRAFT_1167199 [Lentinula guzmanii]|uniref:Uncharacterized protein n=1 Tax=Lentinula guzmanii TaxID=2804957 RepID=A0AA38J234_9AGAR|nr:hypothetical protein DFJ43DRAFT_1167199 [Lentinula guzmanii]